MPFSILHYASDFNPLQSSFSCTWTVGICIFQKPVANGMADNDCHNDDRFGPSIGQPHIRPRPLQHQFSSPSYLLGHGGLCSIAMLQKNSNCGCRFGFSPFYRLFGLSVELTKQLTKSTMMIGFIPKYCKGPVKLLNKKQPNHLMGESHGRKRDFSIGSLINLLAESIRSSNNKYQVFQTTVHFFLKEFRKLF